MIKTECGIVAIHSLYQNNQIVSDSITCLNKMQHRGTESAGIASSDFIKKDFGLVKDVFNNYNCDQKFNNIIGHVRYSTSGKSKDTKLIQPLIDKNICFAFNGNIHNYKKYDDVSCDSLFIFNWISKSNNIIETLIKFMNKVTGTYCIVLIHNNILYTLRDRHGVRPLIMGYKENSIIILSESCALPNDYKYLRDVEPGEILEIKNGTFKHIYQHPQVNKKFCIFEKIYFMNEESYCDDITIKEFRYNTGKQLALKENIINKKDIIVVGAPLTGIIAAKGFADALGLKHEQILHKILNSGRTFILPQNEKRIEACKKGLYIEPTDIVKNKKIYIIDDSIVRGNAMKRIIQMFKECYAKEIHVRVVSPPVKYPCYFGIDIPTSKELFINYTTQELHKELGCDSVKYLDLKYNKNYCSACFDGNYCNSLLDW